MAFRFALLYFVLYSLPFPFLNLWTLFTQSLDLLELEPWPWMRPVTEFFYGAAGDQQSVGWWTGLCQEASTWLGARFGVEVLHQRTGSGDTAHDLFKLLAGALVAAAGTLLWSLLFRRTPHHRRLAPWLHLSARWYVAFAMLGYGMIKFYAGQFRYPHLGRLMTPVGELSPMGLVWTFMGFSKPYEIWVGFGECLAGLLLLSRRTSVLGCLVAVAVMGNVVMLNWLYDVPVKLYSSHLLAIAAVLLLPDLGRLWRMFVANKSVPPARIALIRAAWLRSVLVAFGFLWIGVHLYTSHTRSMEMKQRLEQQRSELYGVWEVREHVLDGEPLAPGQPGRWKLFAIEAGPRGWVRTEAGEELYFSLEEKLDDGELVVTLPTSGETTFAFERGTLEVEIKDPAPRSMADYQRRVSVERPALYLFGVVDEHDVELHLVHKVFELERGFHMLQELPYNR